MTHKTIHFILNGKRVQIESGAAQGIETTKSVLNFLREDRRLVGSKEGCAEGDCGACTVVIGELVNDKLELKSVNACIQFVPTLDGKALFTVEYLGQANGDIHPVQQAMVDHHGSQCGFCTPGFVMSLWSVYVDHQSQQTKPSNDQVRSALSGNLCRCTGYRPILDAGEDMMNLTQVEFDSSSIEASLREIQQESALEYEVLGHSSGAENSSVFHAPKTLDQLTQLRSEKTDSTLLAGSTDIGLWVNKQFRELGDIIYIGEVKELKQIQEDDSELTIGAAVSITEAYHHIAKCYPEIEQQRERFASVPIRNAGTLGGNIANGSPIGDSMPWLITLGAQVQLRNKDGHRVLALEDLYVDYMKQDRKADEIVEAIIVPKPRANQHFRTYKLSKRYDSDISAVCAAFRITLASSTMGSTMGSTKGASDGSIITDARIAFGGLAAIPKRASHTEQLLIGKTWDENLAKAAMKTLSQDYAPLSDMRASASNREQSAKNLLYRFYLETRQNNPLASQDVTVFS